MTRKRKGDQRSGGTKGSAPGSTTKSSKGRKLKKGRRHDKLTTNTPRHSFYDEEKRREEQSVPLGVAGTQGEVRRENKVQGHEKSGFGKT